MVPVNAILLGALVLGEVLLPRYVLGMASIGLGLARIDGQLPRRLLRRRDVGMQPDRTTPRADEAPRAKCQLTRAAEVLANQIVALSLNG